jgi:E3 ubiquitin-protein ligase SIAH1
MATAAVAAISDLPEAAMTPLRVAEDEGDGAVTKTPCSSKRKADLLDSLKDEINLEDELMESLTCIVCMAAMQDSIFQCAEGHMVCESCKPRLHNRCPTCRVPMGNIRNRALERLAALMQLPCKYCDNGCKESMAIGTRKTHQESCEFRPFHCPLSASCNFTGGRLQLMEHLRQGHNVKRQTNYSTLHLQSPCSFLESSSAAGFIFSPTGEESDSESTDLLFVWSQTVHYLQACVLAFDGPSHKYRLRITTRDREMVWAAPARCVRRGAPEAFRTNDCLTVPQSLAGWFRCCPAQWYPCLISRL